MSSKIIIGTASLSGYYGSVPKQEIIDTLNDRDQKDACRLNSPLIKAKDAIELNTTNISIEEQVNFIINIVN